MKKKLSDFPEIAFEFHPTKNGNITQEMVIAGSNKKYWWRCKTCGNEWETRCNKRTGTGKSGCPYCANQKVCKENCLATLFPEIALEFHPTKNGNTTPEMVIAGSHKKYWWQCKTCGNEWEANCHSRTGKGKNGCPYCANQKVCKENCLATLFPEIAFEFHPTKNGNITPEMVVAGSGKKYWWRCKKCANEWETSSDSRTVKKNGCPYCANQKVCKENCLATLFPEIAFEFHPTKNGNITPEMVVAGSGKKYWWRCKKCANEWETRCDSRTGKKNGCPYCANQKVCKENCLATLFPEIALEFHPTKNGNITPEMVIAGSHKKYWWQCKTCGNEWEANCHSRTGTGKSGCPYCKEFKGEKSIRDYLVKQNIKFSSQKKFAKCKNKAPLKFDFMVKIKEKNGFLCEYNGRQHYIPVKYNKKQIKFENLFYNIKRDNLKFEYCSKFNIPFLIIPYWDIDRIDEILDDVLAGRIPKFSEIPQEVTDNFAQRKRIRDRLGIDNPEVLYGFFNFG